ncbi:MAG: GNAT family N-acetyltransferase [Dysgonamonadaceae bacterium]|jgi:diamine N-acetyltransferase|nr:GNAT family N-acetyltransferase [Dysgonamonadaceae bacterium]
MKLLENDIIRLRALEPEDLDDLYRWENDAALWRHGSTLAPYSRFVLRDYLQHSSPDLFQTRQLRLMITEKKTGTAAGTLDLYDFEPVHLRAGVGILLDENYRNRGFGLQALQLTAEYARRILLLKQLYAHIPQSNPASYNLFKKSGYEEAGRLKAWVKTAQGFVDAYLMQRIL